MKLEKLIRRESANDNKKLSKAYEKMESLLAAISKKSITDDYLISINDLITTLNAAEGTDKELIKKLNGTYTQLSSTLKSKLNFVFKNYYLTYGGSYGILGGVVVSSILQSFKSVDMGFAMGVSISLGLIAGSIVGMYLDNKAREDGLQLDLSL